MTTVDPVMRFPGNGFTKAHGLYQFVRVLTFVGQEVKLGLLAVSGVPPDLKGSPTSRARALPPFAVEMLGDTVKGVPVERLAIKFTCHPLRSKAAG